MNIGIISVRGFDYHPTRRLHEAALERGHTIALIHPYHVWPILKGGRYHFSEFPSIHSLDAVLPRQGATIGESCLALIRQLSLTNIPVINNFDAIWLAKNQFHTLMTLTAQRIPVLDSVFVNEPGGFPRAVKELDGYPVVVKEISGRQGSGVFLVKAPQEIQPLLERRFQPRKGLLVQKYIAPHGRRDIRVFVIGRQVIGAMELSPRAGDFRANFHLTGASRWVMLSAAMEASAIQAVDALGLEIAGVDIIIDPHNQFYILEVNYAPGFKGLEAATGLDIAGRMIDYVVDRVHHNKQP